MLFRPLLPLILAGALLTGSAQALTFDEAFHKNAVTPTVDVFFSPDGGCTEAVVAELTKAKRSILVQAYSFTSAPIAQALVAAHRRGVEVKVILDKSQRSEKYTEADFTANAGIPTLIDAKHAIAHNKVMVIDAQTVITGSFNFTKAAEASNAENLLVMHNAQALAQKYLANWQTHLAHSEGYTGKGTDAQLAPGGKRGKRAPAAEAEPTDG